MSSYTIVVAWIKTPGTIKVKLPSKHWVPFESQLGIVGSLLGEFSPLFRYFKLHEKIKYKAQSGKCTLQNYKFKIYLRRTESSVIDGKLAKVVTCLCSVVDFFKSTHWSFMSSQATRPTEHFLKARETKRHKDQEPSRISMKVLRSLKRKKTRRKLKMCIGRYIP